VVQMSPSIRSELIVLSVLVRNSTQKYIKLGAYMQASGAVSRVRQARTEHSSSTERGCPHESRRGHAFCRHTWRVCSKPILPRAPNMAAISDSLRIFKGGGGARNTMSDTHAKSDMQTVQESGYALRDRHQGRSDTTFRPMSHVGAGHPDWRVVDRA